MTAIIYISIFAREVPGVLQPKEDWRLIRLGLLLVPSVSSLGWHYLSNATCLMRPRSFYLFSIVSRIIICQIVRHV